MRVFLDFEASSLSKRSYPIEVAWVFEDGREEAHLIRPQPDWTDWDESAAAVHRLTRERLLAEGEPVVALAARMLSVLSGEQLLASAPSWDGKWLSVLLRGGGLPRHALRLGNSHVAQRETALAALERLDPARREELADEAVQRVMEAGAAEPIAHRALADARAELRRWREAGRIAAELAAGG